MKTEVLAIDVGNTSISLGLFQGVKLLKKYTIPTAQASYTRDLKRFLGYTPVEKAVISSVVPYAGVKLRKALKKNTKVFMLGKDIIVPIQNLYRIKKQVGQDRLVNAFAAGKFYGSPSIIIDFGTAITFDLISRGGAYLGGLILPGIELSLKSLYEKTALLPKVRLAETHAIIGKDTVASMRGGILFGFGAMSDGLISEYRKILGKDTKVIATGGNAKLMSKYSKSIEKIDEDITLKGIAVIAGECI